MSSYLHYFLCTFTIFHLIIASGQSPLNPEIINNENEIKSDNNEIKGSEIQSSKIALQSSKICPKVEKVNDLYGYVKSPKYPEDYPDGVECIYTITVGKFMDEIFSNCFPNLIFLPKSSARI